MISRRLPQLGISPFHTFREMRKQQGIGFFLDSPHQAGPLERFSIMGSGEILSIPAGSNPFPKLADFWNRERGFHPNTASPRFKGGLVGFLSYDAAWFIEKLPQKAGRDLDLPVAAFFVAREFILFDHQEKEIWIVGDSPETVNRMEGFLTAGDQHVDIAQGIPGTGLPSSTCSKSDFEEMVLRCKSYIAAGDIYQANLSQRFEIETTSEPLTIYETLRQINPSPFASFLDFGDFQIIGSSPERLVLLEDGIAQTRPIAGTRPRGTDFREDEALTGELLLNDKERAEHLMLVDLERNDLGRVCDFGTVRVDELMVVEKYSHVMHIVSNVVGKLKRHLGPLDLLTAMFPGGTITGCPKIRSMEIIEELEPLKRGPYTGSIGYIGWNGNMDMSITIRTILKIGSKCYVQAGAGIVADSDPEREYWESVQKAKAMLNAIEMTHADNLHQRKIPAAS